MTSRAKGYPFECRLPEGLPVEGGVLGGHARSLDWQLRRAAFICSVAAEVVEDAAAKLCALIGGEP